MKELIERLRKQAKLTKRYCPTAEIPTLEENAANAIEKLQAENERLKTVQELQKQESKGVEIDQFNKWIPVTEKLPDVERLIAHWQSKADELKKSVEDTCGEASTVSTYKWMHSLWRTVCEFVADLDDLATHCEINNYVENCEECGFCKKGE